MYFPFLHTLKILFLFPENVAFIYQTKSLFSLEYIINNITIPKIMGHSFSALLKHIVNCKCKSSTCVSACCSKVNVPIQSKRMFCFTDRAKTIATDTIR